MKADRRFRSEGDGGGGSQDLRPLLRLWSAPLPPPEVEEQLRRTFRRGRAKRRLAWLAVAASLAIATSLALLFLRASPTEVPGRIAQRPPQVMPSAPPSPVAAPHPVGTRGPEEALPASPKRVRTVRPAVKEVIVEPGQAALLLQLARQLNGTRQASPGLPPPPIVVVPADAPPSPIRKAQTHDSVPPHRDHWKKVESQWPFVHWSL